LFRAWEINRKHNLKYYLFFIRLMALDDKTIKIMIERATSARPKAYVPYSKYKVGVCVLGKSGNLYEGVNVENAIYRVTHAEKLALDKAVMEGEREFLAIVVVTDDLKSPYPCAQCLQDLTEFDIGGSGSLEIIAANLNGNIRKSNLAQLLPERFGPANLNIDVRKY
jgi:cytidine deaminase